MGLALRRFASVAVAAAAILSAGLGAPQVATAGDNSASATFEIAPTGEGGTAVALDLGTSGPVDGFELSLRGPQSLLVSGLSFRENGTPIIITFLGWRPLNDMSKILMSNPRSGVEGPIWISVQNGTDSTRKLHVTARWE